jgi:ATP-dependent helicase HrpB
VTAQPGAGKTTRVPPALAVDGPLILLQPRRVAARSIAQRIADERGWTIGGEVGWQIRFERRFGPQTRLLVATEGVLTARLQQDPLLSQFRTVVLDEFHERSVHADLGIALATQAWRARDDLRIVVMSATLDSGLVSAFLDGCPVVDVPGRSYPIDISYAPGQTVGEAVAGLGPKTTGDILCFLPGALEIRRAIDEIGARDPGRSFEAVPLHGALDASAQDAALRRSSTSRRRVVVATNIAETSVTVPGVMAVVDSGMQKIARYDSERAIDSLEVERITADAADQRAGRAARLGPGVVLRLWDPRDRLRPHREPEIRRVDLSATFLDIVAWGGDPRRFDWFEPPGEQAVEAALKLLERLDAVRDGALTDIGRLLQRMPLHPRLARMLVEANADTRMARACALLSERHVLAPRTLSTSSDLLSAIDQWPQIPPHVQRVARELEQMAGLILDRGKPRAPSPEPRAPSHGPRATSHELRATSLEPRATDQAADFLRAVLAGYPDRVAQRRDGNSPRLRMASGAGAIVSAQSGVIGGEFLVALDVQASDRPGEADARVRLASVVDRDWLTPNAIETVHVLDDATGTVKAVGVERYDALVLTERPVDADPEIRARLLADAWLKRSPREDDVQLLRRLRFAGRAPDLPELARSAAASARSLDDVRIASALAFEDQRALDRDAPETMIVPSGRSVHLEYGEDGSVLASVKLQELFGLADTPRVGVRKEPIRFALLAPNGRPVQVTRDLRSFWDRTYPEVRKELRGRYPKHPWPDDPWTATPTARTKPRSDKR